MTINAVIFDLGGTLIEYAGEYATWPNLETPGFQAAHTYLTQQGVQVDFEVFKQAGFALLPERWQMAARGEKNLRLADLLMESLTAVGIPDAHPDWIMTAAQHYEQAICDQSHPMPAAQETLAKVKAQGYKLGLISNTMFTGNAHKNDMIRYGLIDYFDTLLFSADVDKWKPTAAPFLHVVDALDVEGATAVYIGDDPNSDVVGGQNAGLRTIHFQSSQRFAINGAVPDATIKHLDELLPILQQWE